ncbi:MAG: hypothetical protein V4733_01595 [Verrucomicrobiota bacterium]
MKTLFVIMLLGVSVRAEIVSLAHPAEKFDAADTVVWTPLFQAAWDRLNEEHGGKAVKVEPPNELMQMLDAFQWKPGTVMPEGNWKTWGGKASLEFLARVNREAEGILGEKNAFPAREFPPGSLSVYAVMAKTLEFEKAFSKAEEPMVFRSGESETPVKFFGVQGERSGAFAEFVRVLAYRPKDGSHALEIATKQAGDRVVLYRPPAVQDFATACRWLREWRKTKPGSGKSGAWDDPVFHERDEVQVPYVKLESRADMAARLASLRWFGKKTVPWKIALAEMKTEFELHEKGARVKATVELQDEPFGFTPPMTPRKFVYDRPFFIFLWRDGAEWPYYGVWIGNSEALREN